MTGAESRGLLRTEASTRRATFLELFFDLVYVFALTRVSERLITDFTTARRDLLFEAGETLLLFLALWLVWSFIALTTSRLDPDHPFTQFVVVATMLGAMVMAVAVPRGFGPRAIVFAGAYVVIQVGRPIAGWLATRAEPSFYFRLIFWLGCSAVPWLAGGIVGRAWLRGALWTLAVAIDYGGIVLDWPTPRLGRSRISEWSIGGEHLAERYQQFVLITLGESILVIGLTFSGPSFGFERSAAFLVAFLTSALLWRVYFHRAGHLLPGAISAARHPARLGRAMSYTHLLMVAGIALTAVGYALFIEHPLGRTVAVWLYAILGGPALFLAGRILFEYQVFGHVSRPRIVGLVVLGCLVPALIRLPSLAVGAVAAAVLAAVAAADAARSRGRVRERPAPSA
jgi:low temperature requirement protein LtrA